MPRPSLHGVSTTAINLCFEGDSITDNGGFGPASNDAFRGLVVAQLLSTYFVTATAANQAVSGSNVGAMVSRAAATDARLSGSLPNVLVVLIGTVDFWVDHHTVSGYLTAVRSYGQARLAAGWNVIWQTILPGTPGGFNADRNSANTGIVANSPAFYTGLSHIGANATVGPDAAASDVTYYGDGIHPTGAAYALIAPTITAAVAGVLGCHARARKPAHGSHA